MRKLNVTIRFNSFYSSENNSGVNILAKILGPIDFAHSLKCWNNFEILGIFKHALFPPP